MLTHSGYCQISSTKALQIPIIFSPLFSKYLQKQTKHERTNIEEEKNTSQKRNKLHVQRKIEKKYIETGTDAADKI